MYNSPGWSIRLIRPMADRAPQPRPTAAPFTGRAAAPCRRGRPNMYIRRPARCRASPAGNRPAGAGTVRRWWLFCFAWGLPQPFFWRERLLTHCAAAAPRAGVPRPERCPALPSRIFPRTRTAGSPRWRLPRPLAPAWYASMYMSRAAFPLQAAAAASFSTRTASSSPTPMWWRAPPQLPCCWTTAVSWTHGSSAPTPVRTWPWSKSRRTGWCPPPSEIRTSCRWASGPWRSAMRPDSSPAPSPKASSPASIVRSACRRATASSR